jgi:hypothetical protein
MIRQFAQRWKCGKGSSLSAKFVRDPDCLAIRVKPADFATVGVCSPADNRCDLVTNDWKVWWRKGGSPPAVNPFKAAATPATSAEAHQETIVFQYLMSAAVAVPAAPMSAIFARCE